MSENCGTCQCHYCDGDIEFDASGLNVGDNCSLTCPHCQTECTFTIPAPPPPPPPTLEEVQRGKAAKIKGFLRSQMASGRPVFLYDSVYLPVDSVVNNGGLADDFNLSVVRLLGLQGWEIVQTVPKTLGVALTNISIGSSTGETWGAGMGGNVAGVYLILKKQVLPLDITDDPNDDLAKFILNHLDDFTV